MKALQRWALISAVAFASAAVQAELKELDDSAMSKVEGQKGITIDLEFKLSIGEIAWRDSGYTVVQGLRIGPNENVSNGIEYTTSKR